MNNLIKNIQAALGTESFNEDFYPEAYAGSNVAEELLALDDMDNLSEFAESSMESVVGLAFLEQDIALESAGLALEEFNRYEGSLGNESLTNMAKRGGYNVVIAVKKMLSKIWKFITSVVDFITICDGRWKSYSKLAKKYREKINRLKMHMGEDEGDKEYSLHDITRATAAIVAATTTMGNFRYNSPTGGNPQSYARSAIDIAACMLMTAADIGVSETNNGTATKRSARSYDSIESIRNMIESGGDGWKERLEEIKDRLKEAEETIRETNDVRTDEAKRTLASSLARIETATRRDIKWIKQYKKVQKGIDKAIDKLGRENPNNPNATDGDVRDDLLDKLGVIMEALVEGKKMINLSMKSVNSYIQMVLADAAKVINGETHIGD